MFVSLIVINGIGGYCSIGSMNDLRSCSLILVGTFRNLYSLVVANMALIFISFTCESILVRFIVSPSTLPFSTYFIGVPSIIFF